MRIAFHWQFRKRGSRPFQNQRNSNHKFWYTRHGEDINLPHSISITKTVSHYGCFGCAMKNQQIWEHTWKRTSRRARDAKDYLVKAEFIADQRCHVKTLSIWRGEKLAMPGNCLNSTNDTLKYNMWLSDMSSTSTITPCVSIHVGEASQDNNASGIVMEGAKNRSEKKLCEENIPYCDLRMRWKPHKKSSKEKVAAEGYGIIWIDKTHFTWFRSTPPQKHGTMDIRDTLSGMVGSVCLVYSGLPFDTVKLRLQTDTGNRDDRKQKADSKPSTSTGSLSSHAVPQTAKKQEYRGIVDCVKHMLKHEGLRSFWKGEFTVNALGNKRMLTLK